MAVYKDKKSNTWRVVYRYDDFQDKNRQTQKRGFATRREALIWEREQLNKVEFNLTMTFSSFVDLYSDDMKLRVKENTWRTKENVTRALKHRHYQYGASRKVTAGSRVPFSKGSPGRGCPQTTGSAPSSASSVDATVRWTARLLRMTSPPTKLPPLAVVGRSPLGERKASFDGRRLSKVPLRYFRKSNKG